MIEELLALCRQKSLAEEDLDELVHEASAQRAIPQVNEEPKSGKQDQLLEDAEAAASRINNEGLEAQLNFLVQQYGEAKTRQLIQELEA